MRFIKLTFIYILSNRVKSCQFISKLILEKYYTSTCLGKAIICYKQINPNYYRYNEVKSIHQWRTQGMIESLNVPMVFFLIGFFKTYSKR